MNVKERVCSMRNSKPRADGRFDPLLILKRNAENQARPDLGGHAQINHPNLSALG
jgi:hypothetical protein